MNLINKSYLHPVLRPGYDDVVGTFNFDLNNKVSIGADKYLIDIAAEFENATIEELIRQCHAKIYAFIYCKANFYRNAIEIASFKERIEIPVDNLTGQVEVCIVVSATTSLQYKNEFQHADYGDHSFAISCGDILAVSETNTFVAEKEFDSLQKFESIISITADKSLQRNDPMTIDWSSDKIKVTIADSVFKNYMTLKKARMVTKTLETVISLPILVSIISDWQHDPDSYVAENQDYRWFRAINARAEDLGISEDIKSGIESPFTLAQKMLDAPFSRCLDEVTKKWQDPEEGDDL